ncbi:hypothetical protein GCM10009712_21910 [Pseudarthrobacter sulfonivorans]|jgi:hypothetical protein|uniref:hypothetical protein n=1 Tax=Pseudarthrobacter sulfonivorans TaxID=121292 RepID=UPI00168AF08E|nr:hypothetical protein [Pseudarthrobacter sulfonivorans]
MKKELTIQELESEQVELLPSRETLLLDTNWASVYATNTSLALNAGSLLASANSAAVQTILVAQ